MLIYKAALGPWIVANLPLFLTIAVVNWVIGNALERAAQLIIIFVADTLFAKSEDN